MWMDEHSLEAAIWQYLAVFSHHHHHYVCMSLSALLATVPKCSLTPLQPDTFPFSHTALTSPGAQSKRYSEPANISLFSYFFQRPRKFCQQSLLIKLLPFTTCSMLKVLLSHWNFHLITTFFPALRFCKKPKCTKASPSRNCHQPVMTIRQQSPMSV